MSPLPQRTLTGRARLAGVIGWPVTYSRSPQLHGFWLQEHGIDGAYLPLAVRPERLESAVRGLVALGFAGANVTVPHKERILPLVDRLSDEARRIGAVNTLVIDGDGQIEGRNTDGFGFLENLRAGHPGWSATAGPAVVLGAGGASRAIIVALADAGAPQIRLVNRTLARAEQLAKEFGAPLTVVPWEELPRALDGASLLVNTTSMGLAGEPQASLDLTTLPPEALVTDIVYAPLETPLLRTARARGNPTVDGLGMLLHQARPGFAAWFGVEPQVTPALRAYVEQGL